jgi:hypothetical protein
LRKEWCPGSESNLTCLALQNASSVAGLLLTTEVMIADAPKDEAEHGHIGEVASRIPSGLTLSLLL